MERFVCLHGHFYQPPRENPWTGAIERQPSAGADHDWNRRIARECYAPNARARVLNGAGELAELVNNYAHISFDFGPTLLSWLEAADPRTYAAVLEADRLSAARLGGHGNAVAQAYNHTILPLASPRDRATQVAWGLADFRRRFGRPSEGLWLPETACSDEVLRELIAQGVRFTILAPTQAQAVRPLGAAAWSDVSDGSIDASQPYRWFESPGGRSIDLFFYDGAISHEIAFGKLMASSGACAERLDRALGRPGAGRLVSASTDGESYGHHEPFAEMGLAHLVLRDLPALGIAPVNYAYYLSRFPPTREVRLKPGAGGLGTAWSCAHGVGRWREDCGCGADGRHQKWRRPLREALDWLGARLAGFFEGRGAGLFRDPWAARDGYIEAVLDRRRENVDHFLRERLAVPLSDQSREAALSLLEMQRHAMLMHTSCGWFFAEISELGGVQNLKYAARAIELAREAGSEDLEPEFLLRLEAAPSNAAEFGTGRGVYEKLVLPSAVDDDRLAAHYALAALLGDPPESSEVLGHRAERERFARAGGWTAGQAAFEDAATGRRAARSFLAGPSGEGSETAWISGPLTEGQWEELRGRLERGSQGLLDGRAFGLRDLLEDERSAFLKAIAHREVGDYGAGGEALLEGALLLAEKAAALGLELPAAARGPLELAAERWLAERAPDLLDRGVPGAVVQIRDLLRRLRRARVPVRPAEAEAPWRRTMLERLDRLEAAPTEAALRELNAMIEAAEEAGLKSWRDEAQARFFLIARGAASSGARGPELEAAAKALRVSLEAAASRAQAPA